MSKKLNSVTMEAHGKQVEVHAAQLAGQPAIRVTAVCGEHSVTMTHTFSPENGSLAAPAPGQVQKSLDDIRARAARHAAHKALVAEQMAAAE